MGDRIKDKRQKIKDKRQKEKDKSNEKKISNVLYVSAYNYLDINSFDCRRN